jgi:hypothetical protein
LLVLLARRTYIGGSMLCQSCNAVGLPIRVTWLCKTQEIHLKTL